MTDLLAQVTLEPVTAVPRDRVSNTYAFRFPSGVPTSTQLDSLLVALADIYTGGSTSGDQLTTHLSPAINKAAALAHSVKLYDITGKLQNRGPLLVRGKMREQGPPPHGSPVASLLFTMANVGGTDGLPDEAAAVCTLRGTAWSTVPVESADGTDPGDTVDRPRQRHSGRLYFGPLSSGAKTMTSGVARISANCRSAILARLTAMQSSTELAGFDWSVWSRTEGTLYKVEQIEVDDEFDTQRRRGKRATLRQTAAL